jgi:5'-nucleotidase / UDP-sugar diphosphatase
VQAAQNLIPALQPMCDVLIILSHLGYDLNQHSAAMAIAGDVELARSLPAGAVHLIVGGHTHDVLNAGGLSADNVVNGIPIVQAGHSGQFLGEVDITVGAAPVITDARLRAIESLPVDAAFEAAYVQPLVERVQPYRERVLGRAADEADLRTEAVRDRLAGGESAFANFIADALVTQARARGHAVDFAMIDSTAVGCGLPAGGELTFGHWFDVMPYADVLSLSRLSGRQLRALLQDNALRVDRPDEPRAERGFLHFSAAVRYSVLLGQTRGQAQVTGIDVNGCPIASCLERSFLVASTSFVHGLAAAWEAEAPEAVTAALLDLEEFQPEFTRLYVRDLMVDYIVAHGGMLPEGGARRDGRLRVG